MIFRFAVIGAASAFAETVDPSQNGFLHRRLTQVDDETQQGTDEDNHAGKNHSRETKVQPVPTIIITPPEEGAKPQPLERKGATPPEEGAKPHPLERKGAIRRKIRGEEGLEIGGAEGLEIGGAEGQKIGGAEGLKALLTKSAKAN